VKPRLYACAVILGAILLLTIYSDRSMAHFIQEVETSLTKAEAALEQNDNTAAMQSVAYAVDLCCDTRSKMTHVLRIEDLTELEGTLEAVIGYLEYDAPEEALGELHRAGVQVRSLERLSHRLI
jgi:hypothetical protein